MFFQNYRPGKFFVSRTNPNTRFQNGKKMPASVNWHCNKQRLFYASCRSSVILTCVSFEEGSTHTEKLWER